MEKCYLCNSTEQDEVKYGEFMTRKELSVHYFCLLLTSNLLQRGKDNEGFLGFLVVDIKNEAVRVAPMSCCYCKKKGANIACCAQKCRRSFHLICGIKNDCENQFVGTFKSFCDRHVSGKKLRGPQKEENCCICYDDLKEESGKFNCVTMLQAPCCKNGWFHKWCLASFAKSAGYFFKCPLCNDSKKFRQRLVYKGIFIPDRDASWELEPNAFSELLERPGICSADTCTAKGGRTANNTRNKLTLCLGCGSIAMHRCCIEKKTDNFYCKDCQETFTEVNDTTVVNMSRHSETDDEEEDVDICGEVDDVPIRNNTESPEETIRPMGRLRNIRRPFSDDETPVDVDITDTEDDVVSRYRFHRRVNRINSFEDNISESSEEVENIRVQRRCRRNGRIESSDSGNSMETVVCEAKLRTSKNSDSFFDSGAGSDRSDCSTDKPHLMDNSKTVTIECKNNRSISRRFTSLNNEPKGDLCIAKRTRRQSMYADVKITFEGSDTSKESSPRCRIRSSSLTISSPSSAYVSMEAPRTDKGKGLKSEAKKTDTGIIEPVANESVKKKRMRCLRSQSEECPKKLSTTATTLRRNSLQVVSSSNQDSSCSSLLPDMLREDVLANKRTRNDSQSSAETSLSKKQKTSTILNENENDYNHTISRRTRLRSSRSRSPLGSNFSSVNAFITPSYVREKQGQSGMLIEDDCLRKETLEPRIENIFSKNRVNISNQHQSTQKSESSQLNPHNSALETFANSYSLLLSTTKRKRSRKNVFHRFADNRVPSNQTKIETFFKRI